MGALANDLLLEPVMSMHVEDSEEDFDFEEWRRNLIAKKKKKKMNMESN